MNLACHKTKEKEEIMIPPETFLGFELLAADGAVEGGLLVELEVHPQGRVLRAHLPANVAPVRRWRFDIRLIKARRCYDCEHRLLGQKKSRTDASYACYISL